MSRTATLAYVKTVCTAITGVVTVTIGRPNIGDPPEAGIPWIVLGAPQPRWTPYTLVAGGAGRVWSDYPVNILVVMGRKDMLPSLAEAARALWAQRIHQAFSNDTKLGGNVWDAEVMDGIDNVDTYTMPGAERLPQALFHLMVREDIARNAVAS